MANSLKERLNRALARVRFRLTGSEHGKEHDRMEKAEYDARWKRWREEAKSEQGPRPPWVEFEGYAPGLPGWSQSVAEDWLTFCWFPYWDKLDASKRSAYLDRWHVGLGREWQEWLSFIDDPQRKKKSGS